MFGLMKKKSTVYFFLYGKMRDLGHRLLLPKKKSQRITAWLKLNYSKNFLKEHHCRTWRQYNKDYDPDVIKYATLISQYYHGYPYICHFENTEQMSKHYRDWQDWLRDMRDWGEKNCLDKFRYDIHRVIREKGLIRNEYDDTMIWTDIDEFSMNDVGGWDVLFFAFKSKRDLAWFKLRWM